MPGELANIMAGRVAALFNLRGPNFTTDAACASALAGMSAAIAGLQAHHYDACVAGGVDHNMGPGRLRAVLQDRRPVGHRHPAVRRGRRRLRDGRGRGPVRAQAALGRREGRRPRVRGHPRASAAPRTARARASPPPTRSARSSRSAAPGRTPEPIRARSGCSRRTAPPPASATPPSSAPSTRSSPPTASAPGSIALGSVKSNIGHLKAAAGAAGHVQGRHEPQRQGAAPEPALQRPEPERGLGRDPVPRQHRAARVDPLRARPAARRRERLRLRRHQLPRGPRGVRARSAPRTRRRARVRRRRHPGHDGRPGALPRRRRPGCAAAPAPPPARPPCAAPP